MATMAGACASWRRIMLASREITLLAAIALMPSCRPAQAPSAATAIPTDSPAVVEARTCPAPRRDLVRDALVEASHLATGKRADQDKLDEWSELLCNASEEEAPAALAGIV